MRIDYKLVSKNNWWFVNEDDLNKNSYKQMNALKIGFSDDDGLMDYTNFTLFPEANITKEVHIWAKDNFINLHNMNNEDLILLQMKFEKRNAKLNTEYRFTDKKRSNSIWWLKYEWHEIFIITENILFVPKLGFDINNNIADMTLYDLPVCNNYSEQIHTWAKENYIDFDKLSDEDIQLIKMKWKSSNYENPAQYPRGYLGSFGGWHWK